MVIVIGVFSLTPFEAAITSPLPVNTSKDVLHDLTTIDELKVAFEADTNHPRLILIVAPT